MRGELVLPRPSFIFSTQLGVVLCHLALSMINLCPFFEDAVERGFAKAIYAVYLRVEDEVFGAAAMVAFAAENHMVERAGQAFVLFARGFGAAADVVVHFGLWVSALYSQSMMSWSQLASPGSEMGLDVRLKILIHCYDCKSPLMVAKRPA